MRIEDHLAEHERAIVGLARRTAHRYHLSRDLAEDLAQVGRIALWRRHEDGYDHGRASLLTASYRSILWAMNAAAKEQADGPILIEPTDVEAWDGLVPSFRSRTTTGVFVFGPGPDLDERADAA